MDIKRFQQTFQSRGIRIPNDDPMFLLLEQNEKVFKEYVEQMQKKYAVSVHTEYWKEESLRQKTAKLYVLGGALIFIVFVFGLLVGSASQMIGFGSFFLGCGLGVCFGIAGLLFAQNITKIEV